VFILGIPLVKKRLSLFDIGDNGIGSTSRNNDVSYKSQTWWGRYEKM